jgi:hypothetical protein
MSQFTRPSTPHYEHHPSRVFPQVSGSGSDMTPSIFMRIRRALFNTTGNVRATARYREDDVEEGEEVTSRPPSQIKKLVTWGNNTTRTMSRFGKKKINREINYKINREINYKINREINYLMKL